MKIQKLFFILIAIFLFLLTACVNGVKNEEQKIVVYKNSGNEEYEYFNEINDIEQVQKVKDILVEIEWESKVVNMSRSADYQFFFHYKNKNIDSDAIQHLIWISPNKDKLEVVRGNDEYTQLTKEQSELFFEIITGEKLANLK